MKKLKLLVSYQTYNRFGNIEKVGNCKLDIVIKNISQETEDSILSYVEQYMKKDIPDSSSLIILNIINLTKTFELNLL